jgi:hypothetical protein
VWPRCKVATRLAVDAEIAWGCRSPEPMVLVRSGDGDNVHGMLAVIRVLGCHAVDILAILARALAASVDRFILSVPLPVYLLCNLLTRLGFLVISSLHVLLGYHVN